MTDELKKLVGGMVDEMAQEAVQQATAQVQGAHVVRDPGTNAVNFYATKVLERHMADGLYLALQRTCGHDEAVAQTCSLYGHDARAGRCLRCGVGITGAEARASREQAQRRMTT